jgi:DNA-binding MarR family transcriptional regulator
MTHRLDRMAQRRLIARNADPDNRTRVLVTLTDQGWQTFKAAVRESDMVESDVLRPLSRKQRESLGSLLELLIAGLDQTPAG